MTDMILSAPKPAPSVDAEDAWLEHIRSNNYDHECENIHSAFIAGFNAALCRASTLWMIQHHYTEAGAEEDTER